MANSDEFSVVAKLELVRVALGLKLPLYELKTLAALITWINGQSGEAFPSHSRLAASLGIDERNLFRALRGLQERGLVMVAKHGGGRRHSSRYVVDFEAVRENTVSKDATSAFVETPGSRLQRRQGGVCRDAETASVETGKEQLRATEGQRKERSKLFASSRSFGARSPGGARAPEARKRTQRNSWIEKYRTQAAPAPAAADDD